MSGIYVIAMTYGGSGVRHKIWDWTERVAYLVDDNEFAAMSAGDSSAVPIGFPREDVFADSEALVSRVDRGLRNWWKSCDAVPWQPLG